MSKLAQGFLTSDRFSAYKNLFKLIPGLTIAFCWGHFRCDFIHAALGDKSLEPWAGQWKQRIAEILQLNKTRSCKTKRSQERDFPRLVQGRLTTLEDLHEVRRLIVDNPQASRYNLASLFCCLWEWYSPAGK